MVGLTDMTDAGQLAGRLLWATETEAAHDQAFNVDYGDVFRWQWMWSRIADGRVEAAGSDADLLARGGRYAELFELQAAGYQ